MNGPHHASQPSVRPKCKMDFTTELIELLVQESVKSFEVVTGSTAGDNHCSEIFRIVVETNSEKTINLIYKKFPANDMAVKKYAVRAQLFRRENYFYSTFAPNVENVLRSHLQQTDLHTNNCEKIISVLRFPIPNYVAGLNDDENDYVCLQDLRPLGFQMGNKNVGLNYLECTLALKKLASFHAITYFYLKFETEDIFQRENKYQVYLTQQWAVSNETITEAGAAEKVQREELLKSIYKNSIELIRRNCSSEDMDMLLSKMTGENECVINSAYANITRTTLRTDSNYFPLFIHGDLWINNMLFLYNQNGAPIDLKFIDFQFSRRGNIYEDLNFLLFTSTTAEFRKNHLRSSLDVYYDAFISTLKQIDFPPPSKFARHQFINDFYDNVLPAYLILSYLIPMHLGKCSDDGSKDADFAVELIKKMERSPVALLRWEEATREAVQMKII